MAIDYRGIITRGYYNDSGGQNTVMIVSQGYVGSLAELTAANIIRMVNVALVRPVMGQAALLVPGVANIIMSIPTATEAEMEV